jgi:hypothetical protein
MKTHTKKKLFVRLALLFLISLTGCQNSAKPSENSNISETVDLDEQSLNVHDDCMMLSDLQEHQNFSIQILDDDPEAVQDIVLANEFDNQQWKQAISLFPPGSNSYGWASLFVFDRKANVTYLSGKVNPILLTQEKNLAYFMVRNGWALPHSLRLIVMLDFQPANVLLPNGTEQPFYDFATMQPQEDSAIAFSIPSLSSGFHQLSLLLIADPENTTPDKEYRLAQKLSITEARFDLWVDHTSVPEEVSIFSTPELGQAAASRIQSVDLVTADSEISSGELLTSLNQTSNTEACIYLKLFNIDNEISQTFKEPIPLRVVVFWDDHAYKVLDYDLLPEAEDFLALPLKVAMPKEPGTHQLQVFVFTFPGFSQFDAQGQQRTGYPIGVATQRVLVDINE